MSFFKTSLVAFLCFLPSVFSQINDKPFVIPELQKWYGKEGFYSLTNQSAIVLSSNDEQALKRIAQQFASDLKLMFGKDIPVTTKEPHAGDIVLSIAPCSSDNQEAYEIDIDHVVTIKANEPVGAFWATRTILQMMEQSTEQNIPKGSCIDYPKYPVRGFMLDCGRKFFRLNFLNDYIKFMAYYKMNTFQIHLNDNGFRRFFNNEWDKTYSAFRLESSVYPGLTAKDGSYSKQEFINLQKEAEAVFVNIIPEIDVPAHSLAFSHYMPEIGSKEYGMDHLDLFSAKTYEFLDALLAEYLSGGQPVFRGKQVNIGTDEYSNKDKRVVEQFRYFTDYYIRYVEQFGKQAVIWGALTHAKGDTPVKADNVIMNAWHNPYAQPKEMAKLGYHMISIPDGLLYIVPAAGYYYDYLNIKHLYSNWEPRFIGKEEFEEGNPLVLGGMFAVWNDHVGNGISEKDVHHRIWPAMQTLAVKMWTAGNTSLPFDTFNAKREQLSEAPGVNIMAKVGNQKGLVLHKEQLGPNEQTGLKEIGYGYRVEFQTDIKEHTKGTVLFQSENAIFYLSDPKDGKMGFERDGYLFTFDYIHPQGQTVTLAIEGDSKSTTLYVNGELKERLDIIRVQKGANQKDTIAQVRTLVFPLEKTGSFHGTLKNIKVYKR